jgi:hypothetical protein
VPSKPGAPIVSKTPIFKYLFILALLVWLLFGIYIIAPGVILHYIYADKDRDCKDGTLYDSHLCLRKNKAHKAQ